jgi:DNA polymerase I
MIFQILDADYTYSDNLPAVRLYGRDGSGNSVCCMVTGFEPYFYAKAPPEMAGIIQEKFKEQIKKIEPVSRFEPVGYFKNKISMLKIILFDPKGVPIIRDEVRKMVDEIYETDILFRNRYMVDNGLGGMSWANVEQEGTLNSSEVLSTVKIISKKVVPVDILKNAPLRHLAFDIECLPLNGAMPVPETSPIILLSLAFAPEFNGKKTIVLVGKNTKTNTNTNIGGHVEICGSEERMLRRFFEIIKDFDPDILAGYNSNSFDIPYIVDRVNILNKKGARIDSIAGRDGRTLYYRKIGNVTRVSVMGRIAVDVLPLLRKEFSLKQYTLRNAAKELLGTEKLDIPILEMEDYWNDNGEKLSKFIEYARRDSELALLFLLKLRLIDKYIALARVSGTLLQDILDGGQTQMVENLILREYMKHDRVLATRPTGELSGERYDEGEELAGAEVLPPKKGLLENIVILDYKSLYPTIMMAHNLCYTTEVVGEQPEDVIKTPNGGVFVSRNIVKGIVPSILEELLDRRQQTRAKMKTAGDEDEKRVLDATQLALKILLNSFYGYSGYTRARLYSLTLAGAVTSFGRENIMRTKDLIENDIKEIILKDGQAICTDDGIGGKHIGLSVVYGDTDSVFVHLLDKEITFDEAQLVGNSIANTVTESLVRPMELVFDSFAKRAIFLAKKRYALLVQEKNAQGLNEKIKVKGMETVRRDWCELTTKTIEKVLELVLKEAKVDEAVLLVKNTINEIKSIDANSSFFDSLILTRQYTKSIGSYKNKQPHITVIEKLQKRGIISNVGDRIPFVIIAGNAMFVERAEDPEYAKKKNLPIDVDYYINKQILPPVERILSDFGVTREMLRGMGERKVQVETIQKQLFEF